MPRRTAALQRYLDAKPRDRRAALQRYMATLPMVDTDPNARNYWPTEVRHMTPWVVENLDRVGHEVGLDLDPTTVRCEVPLGERRSADIVVRDRCGRTIVIENQLGPSDDQHFTKTMVYADQAPADVVIWIVAGTGGRPYSRSPVSHVHQRLLTGLNARVPGTTAFYALEIYFESDRVKQLLPDGTFPLPCLPRLRLAVQPPSRTPIHGPHHP